MRILDKYLLGSFVNTLIYCLCLFFVLFIVIDIFNNLDEFLKSGVHIKIIVSYYLFSIPNILIQVVPVAVLVSILYTLGTLNRNSEITAMKASGISAFHILTPYLFIGALISFSILSISEKVVPKTSVTSTSIMEGLIERGKKDYVDRIIRNVTLFAAGNRMVYAREFELSTNTLYDVVILDDQHRLVQTKITAKKAIYSDQKWHLYEAIQFQMNNHGELEGDPRFSDSMVLNLNVLPGDFLKESTQIETMSTAQLKEYVDHLRGASQKLVQKLMVDFHYKIAFPFVSFIVILIGAPLAMRSERGGALKGIGASIGIVLVYYGINSLCLAFGKGGHLPPIFSAWFSNLFFACFGIYLIKTNS